MQCRASHGGDLSVECKPNRSRGLDRSRNQEIAGQYLPPLRSCLKTRWGVRSEYEIVTNLNWSWLGFDKWRKFPELRRVVEMLPLTVGKCSYTFDVSDVVAKVMDLNESSSVLYCVRSWCSHEGRSWCAEKTAVVKASQEAMSQRERLLVPSRVSP